MKFTVMSEVMILGTPAQPRSAAAVSTLQAPLSLVSAEVPRRDHRQPHAL